MAEIIVEPTALSKVIPLKFKINDVDVPKTTQLSTNKQFNTTDTDAWFTFELDGLASTSGTYDLTLINLDDKSIFHHADVIFAALPFHYKLNSSEDVTLNEIRHAGRWLGQLVVTMANGDTTARQFGFNISGHILDGQDAQVILLSDYQALINTINLAKDDLAQYNVDYAALIADVTTAEGLREQAEIDRAAAFAALVESEMIAQNVATKLTEKEATFAPRMLSLESELADKADKTEQDWATLNTFDEATRTLIQGITPGQINAVLGARNAQSINIAQKAVTPIESQFFRQSENLFNKNTVVNNMIVSITTGLLSAATDYFVSDFIPIKPNASHIKNENGNIAYYTYDKVFISGKSLSSNTTDVAPSNAYYVRTSFYYPTKVNTFMLVDGTVLPSSYVDHYYEFDETQVAYPLNIINGSKVDAKITTALGSKKFDVINQNFFKMSENLFNKNVISIGTLVNKYTGLIVTSDVTTAYTTSDYISVVEGESYICNKSIVRIAYYDANKNVLSSLGTHTATAASTPITIPAGVFYTIFSYGASALDQSNTQILMYVKGITLPSVYIPHYWTLDLSDTSYPIEIELTNWFRKKGSALGDSNTQNGRWQPYVRDRLLLDSIQNCGIGGTRMSGTGAEAMWQDVRVNAINTDVDFVSVMAGTNDSAGNAIIGDITLSNVDTNTFVGAYNVCLQKIYTRCGNDVTILLFVPIPAFDAAYSTNLKSFVDAVRAIGDLWHLPVIDAYKNMQVNHVNYLDYYSVDGIHMGDLGGQRLASIMVGSMKNNEPVI